MTSPNAQINIKHRDLLPRISLPDDVSGYIFFRRSIQGWRWHPIRCLSPLHSGPGAPGSRTHQRGHRPSPFACASLSPQHHCCWTRNIATNRLLWPEPVVTPPQQLRQNDCCCCASNRFWIGEETRNAPNRFLRFTYANRRSSDQRWEWSKNNQRAVK